ncbi:MAG: energy transducer TonB [bacterium]|nr:energy transducer TonB [bacterium]
MKHLNIKLLLLALGLLLCVGCERIGAPAKYLISARVTSFATQSGSSQIHFPVMAQRIGSDELVREIDEAEYYYKKLSALYDFKTFALLGTQSLDTVLQGEASLPNPVTLLPAKLSGTKVTVKLLAINAKKGEFQWSMQDSGKSDKQYFFPVENGKSSSIGVIVDSLKNAGVLTVVSFWVMPIDKKTTPEMVKQFLASKNRVKNPANPILSEFSETDQSLLDQLFGAGKLNLPMPARTDSLSEKEVPFINLDQPPLPIGGMSAIAKRFHYPDIARDKQIQGTVFLSLLIDSTGKIARKKILRGVHPELDRAALACIDSVQFSQPRAANKPVNAWVTLPISFRLQ